MSDDENLVGKTLAGKYRVEKVLGQGGMGVVVGARHLGLDEPVAVKLLRPGLIEVEGMVTRFLREARAASKIKSPHVVRVTDVDTLDDGAPYMVMELLDGVDFAVLRRQEGQLPPGQAVRYLLEACDAIAEAHELGIVHRDLKPSNLFLHRGREGRRVVKVLDFGISKLESPGEQDSTKKGEMMGSPKYMSPEQMLSMHDVDARSDIWSLGAILYELVTGRAPFVADTTPRICAQVLNNDPDLPSALRPEIPIALEMAILRCLEKKPERRFASVAQLVAALEPLADVPTSGPTSRAAPDPAALQPPPGEAVTAVTDDTKTRIALPVKKRPRRGRVAAAVLAGIALLGGLGAIYAAQRRGREAVAEPVAHGTAVAAAAISAPPPAGAAQAEPERPALRPEDLPDVQPAGGPAKPVKKPKPAPTQAPDDDPFGGRRN
jgi:serine/threonine protein kinase